VKFRGTLLSYGGRISNIISESEESVSNGHSPANLANLSTRQNGHFWKYARLASLADIRQTLYRGLARLADICQAVYRVLARLADICQTVYRGLARLAKGEFGECYTSLANLANVG
jgi:hypothetical protein